MSTIITDNFTRDPAYSAYSPEVRRSYVESNSPSRLLEALASPHSHCITALLDSEIAGAILLGFYPSGYPEENSENSWRIRRLHVAKAFRNLGIARNLLGEAEKFVVGQGHGIVFAEATPEAAGLLVKNGWTGRPIAKDTMYRDDKEKLVDVTVPRFIASKSLATTSQER